MRILMVCLGNICRSPLAEGILRAKAAANGLKWEIDSAGLGGWHEGEAPHQRSIAVANQHGIDISRQRARKIEKNDFDAFDVIFPMDIDNRDALYEMASTREQRDKVRLIMDVVYPNKNVSVPDPYYSNEAAYQNVFEMLDAACDKVVEIYGSIKKSE